MSSFVEILLTVIGSVASLGILAGGLGYFIKNFRKGTKEEKSEIVSTSQEVINFWKAQSENFQLILERKEKEWNEKFQALTRELGEVRGKFDAERTQNERLEKIFQNRDPESQKFMEFVVVALKDQQSINEKMLGVLSDIHTLAVEERNREMKVETTVSKV